MLNFFWNLRFKETKTSERWDWEPQILVSPFRPIHYISLFTHKKNKKTKIKRIKYLKGTSFWHNIITKPIQFPIFNTLFNPKNCIKCKIDTKEKYKDIKYIFERERERTSNNRDAHVSVAINKNVHRVFERLMIQQQRCYVLKHYSYTQKRLKKFKKTKKPQYNIHTRIFTLKVIRRKTKIKK